MSYETEIELGNREANRFPPKGAAQRFRQGERGATLMTKVLDLFSCFADRRRTLVLLYQLHLALDPH